MEPQPHLIDILGLAVLPAFLLLDLFHRVRHPGRADAWRLRALAVTTLNFLLSLQVGAWWGALFGGASLLAGAGWPLAAQFAAGVLVYELAHYWYHRAAHRWNWLWHAGHQMHHSAERVDPWGAYFLHPVDTALFTSCSALVLFGLLGLSPQAAGAVAAFLGFCSVFQHADLDTPRWLGWLVQRPESHAIHHERGVHAYNYADLPLWDWVFGTLRNPRRLGPVEQGFYDGASRRLLDMLLFRDVSTPRRPAKEAP
jgi:sterol desaturase/sphingolipid hydroxylase (fatty acid hydroxylase superfamily)